MLFIASSFETGTASYITVEYINFYTTKFTPVGVDSVLPEARIKIVLHCTQLC